MTQALLNGMVSGLLIALPAIALSLTYGILNFANFSVGAMITGSRVDLKVLRGSSEEHISVTLDAMPNDNQRADQTEPAPRLRRRG